MFEQNTEQYGEIVYRLGGKTDTNRLVTAEGVLETIFGLAGVTPEPEDESRVFRGHPLAAPPRHASVIFYGLWPAAIAAAALLNAMASHWLRSHWSEPTLTKNAITVPSGLPSGVTAANPTRSA